ncbi:methionine ABC transporter ATP-binding protein [Suttonella sp. R2A3]|uniref:methionine ABC transporter ATP-binding protein n=1 Tax=Suttonella sp. R2A3 TaxID=2908648 RepID=UPI001F373317|nr:methionine ABC transporter ATP-binding protein [Suttonella sp. R2A3]UJF25068.1 methionine ABC transporter ATP-binding protein [Suttonella sp. R2A3]
MIKLSNISKTYTHAGQTIHALDGVNLEVERGQIYGVVGQSGAGKSTLIRCVNLLERPSAGTVTVDGKELTALTPQQLLKARHEMGMIFQHFNLLSSRTVYDNIALPLELIGESKRTINEKVRPLLALTGLEDKVRHYPSQLSGGQKQRVAIARALASDPKVLLSDEATSALDPKTTESILELLRDINEQLGLTILMITHEMEVVKKICHRVALIEDGKLVETNHVEAFFSQPQSELGRKFIAQIQQFDLPPNIASKLREQGSHPVVKLAFHGDNVDTPLLSHLTRTFDIDVNIIQAKVEHIRSSNLGLLIAELEGSNEQNQAALEYLRAQPIELEVLGYVEPTH